MGYRARPIGPWTTSVLLFVVATQAAQAGLAESDACAQSLTSTGQRMYDAVIVQLATGSDPETTARNAIRALVQAGSVTRNEARENADAVSECLVLLKEN